MLTWLKDVFEFITTCVLAIGLAIAGFIFVVFVAIACLLDMLYSWGEEEF